MSVTANNVSAWLYRVSNGYTIVVAIALYGLFIATVMGPESEIVSEYAGGWGSPDGHVFYTPDEFYREISTWGDAGRAHYVDFRLGLDPVWAFVYTAFLITITSVALRYAFAVGDTRRLLNLVALAPMLADLVENGLGMLLMSSYPTRLDWLAWITTGVSGFKWTTLAIAHLVMIYALAAAAVALIRKSKHGV